MGEVGGQDADTDHVSLDGEGWLRSHRHAPPAGGCRGRGGMRGSRPVARRRDGADRRFLGLWSGRPEGPRPDHRARTHTRCDGGWPLGQGGHRRSLTSRDGWRLGRGGHRRDTTRRHGASLLVSNDAKGHADLAEGFDPRSATEGRDDVASVGFEFVGAGTPARGLMAGRKDNTAREQGRERGQPCGGDTGRGKTPLRRGSARERAWWGAFHGAQPVR